jgi:2-polyprenyl-6-methoxyphenol hydroxylase-like FAD-dependent oxidoreductase
MHVQAMQPLQAQCCIAGGGPAGMMAGLLLARAGVDTIVLEKHADFLRDFRGDTIHPSTLEVIHELGLLDEFLKRPHQVVRQIRAHIGDEEVVIADFSHLPVRCPYIALMPQWDFLDFLVQEARRYRTFRLLMQADVTDLLQSDGQVIGVRAQTLNGPLEVRTNLTIGADGRGSRVRQCARLHVRELGAPMDVLWMRISRRASDPDEPLGRIERGRMMVLIYRGDYWQCGFLIHKGGYDEIRSQGLESFRRQVAELVPFLRDRAGEIRQWEDVRLLTVKVDRLQRWYRPGLLCIGDAAHAMSPVGGVGINLAIQDAVATANLLAEPLGNGKLTTSDLHDVQRRRELPARLTQAMQVFVQNRVISQVLGQRGPMSAPWPVRLLKRWPWLRRIPARMIGIGVRPEHVRS